MSTSETLTRERPLSSTPNTLRPREMMERFGADNVSEQVLIAVLLRSGTRGTNVVSLSRILLQEYRSLTELARASVEDLAAFPGLGRVKAQVLKAALELGTRLSVERSNEDRVISGPRDAALLLRERARSLETEKFWVLCLDTRNQLKKIELVTSGLVDASLVHPREVFRPAIRQGCTSVILAHNHPSGNPDPSPEDLAVTKQLLAAGRIIDIQVLDHVIIGQPGPACEEGFFSIRESGLVTFD